MFLIPWNHRTWSLWKWCSSWYDEILGKLWFQWCLLSNVKEKRRFVAAIYVRQWYWESTLSKVGEIPGRIGRWKLIFLTLFPEMLIRLFEHFYRRKRTRKRVSLESIIIASRENAEVSPCNDELMAWSRDVASGSTYFWCLCDAIES